jgi:hypothetical protein
MERKTLLNNRTSQSPGDCGWDWPNNNAVQLGQAVADYLQSNVEPKQSVSARLIKVWDALLPTELAQHCRLDSLKGSVLTVSVDAPVYMHELRLCSGEILSQLRDLCPAARIKKIKPILK